MSYFTVERSQFSISKHDREWRRPSVAQKGSRLVPLCKSATEPVNVERVWMKQLDLSCLCITKTYITQSLTFWAENEKEWRWACLYNNSSLFNTTGQVASFVETS